MIGEVSWAPKRRHVYSIQSSLLCLQSIEGGYQNIQYFREKHCLPRKDVELWALDGTSLPSLIDKWQHTILQYTVTVLYAHIFLSGQLTATLLFKPRREATSTLYNIRILYSTCCTYATLLIYLPLNNFTILYDLFVLPSLGDDIDFEDHIPTIRQRCSQCKLCPQCLIYELTLRLSYPNFHQLMSSTDKFGNILVLLHNGGSCNACTMKRCITFRCITKQTTLLNVAIT